MQLESGHVLAAKMNAHRHQWNGSICAQPVAWNCGATAEFRESYCAQGMSRCFHLHVFDPSRPVFITPEFTILQAVQERPTLLDNQLLFFYGGRFGSQQGVRSGDEDEAVYGFYRIKSASLDTSRSQHQLRIEPHADGWAVLPRGSLRRPALRNVPDFKYFKKVRYASLIELVEHGVEQGRGIAGTADWSAEQQRRLSQAAEALPRWLVKAEEALAKIPAKQEPTRVLIQSGQVESALASKLKGLRLESARQSPTKGQGPLAVSAPATSQPLGDRQETQPASATSEPLEPPKVLPVPVEATIVTPSNPEAPAALNALEEHSTGIADLGAAMSDEEFAGTATEPRDVQPTRVSVVIPEPTSRQLLEETYDSSLVGALTVGFLTKSLVILSGAPGAGKSWMASRLLDDPGRERTLIVPVASTWRGREDLLGYVNPISSDFEPSQLTLFLCAAEDAWAAGDHRSRLVVFEEFNLSQPEHWLSDLLVRLEYEPDQLSDRTISLGGRGISGLPGRKSSVTLVPTVRFAATLNNDHTVKPLSPRVLDRAALIEVVSSGRSALQRAGLELEEEIAELIDGLDDLLSSRGAAFSMRSARSLQRALAAGSSSGMTVPQALDFVLAQEVLSRVRLMAGDPRDERLVERLQAWGQRPACNALSFCVARIADWSEAISSGRDVFQA